MFLSEVEAHQVAEEVRLSNHKGHQEHKEPAIALITFIIGVVIGIVASVFIVIRDNRKK